MRRQISWKLGNDYIYGTLDTCQNLEVEKAVLIVSGGNEIRSGAHNSQSNLAQYLCSAGYHVLRYDRRGIGESEGINKGFDNSADDIKSAINFLQAIFNDNIKVVALGNCDAASALLLNHQILGLNQLIITNPWTMDAPSIDETQDCAPTTPDTQPTLSASAIRARYWAKIKNPRSLIDLFTGKINLRKLIRGLFKAGKQEGISNLAKNIGDILSTLTIETHILIADKDSTAMAFMSAYKSKAYNKARANDMVKINSINSASHSFADNKSRQWLYKNILDIL